MLRIRIWTMAMLALLPTVWSCTNMAGGGNMDGDNGMVGGETLYAADGAGGTPMLYRVNTADAGTTAIGAIGFAVNGMARSDTGTMYGVTAEAAPQLITINTATGQGTAVAPISNNPSSIEDLAFRGNQLYGWFIDANGPDYLVTIDTTTGAATRVGNFDLEATGGGLEYGGATDPNVGLDVGFVSGTFTRDGGGATAEFTNVDFDDGSSFAGDNMMGQMGDVTALSHFMGRLYAVDGLGAAGARLGTVDPTMGQFVGVGALPDNISAIAGTVK